MLNQLPKYPRLIAKYLVENEGYAENEAAAVAVNHTRRVVCDPAFGSNRVQEAAKEAMTVIEHG